jgi:L-ascorbate metabolism protein UlaG (beta-lactamase superfamily)
MSPREVAYASKLLEPETVIPLHFGTFPQLAGKPGERQALVPGVKVVERKPGQTIS